MSFPVRQWPLILLMSWPGPSEESPSLADKTPQSAHHQQRDPSPAAQRREGLGTHQGGQRRKLVGLRHLMASCPSWTRLAERLACLPIPASPRAPSPAFSHSDPLPLDSLPSQGPEAEWSWRHSHILGWLWAFLASETQVFQEPAFPMRLSSMKAGGGGRGGDSGKGWRLGRVD